MLMLTLLACSEVEYSVNNPEWVNNPPNLAAEIRTDRLVQLPVPSVDVLFAVDNSESMAEEQTSLTDNFDGFMDLFLNSETDYHLGVIATDMDDPDHGGRLVSDGGKLYIDDTLDREQALESFARRAILGTDGARLEKGLESIYNALERLADNENAGFYRPEAYLAVVVISDEDDYSSSITVTGFKDWLGELKNDRSKVTFSAVVSTEEGCPEEPGLDYVDVAENFDGVVASICDTDWDAVVSDLGLAAAGLQREFFLSEIPVDGSIEVQVVPEGDIYTVGGELTYDASRNSVSFTGDIPNALSEVFITYELKSSVAEGAEPGATE